MQNVKHSNRRAGAIVGLTVLLATTVTPVFSTNGRVYASFENGVHNTNICVPSDSKGVDGDISADKGGDSGGSANTSLGVIPQQRLKDAKEIAHFLNDKYGFGQDQLASIMATGWRESNWDLNVVNPGGQVKGIFQWSNGGVNGNRIGDAGVDGSATFGVKETEQILDFEIGQGKNASAVNMVKAMQSVGNDKSKAFVAWALFEGVSISDGQSKTSEVIKNADAVAKVLGTDDMKIDQGKIDKLVDSYGGKGNANTDTSTSGKTTEVTDTNNCDPDGGENSDDSVDGTGSYTKSSDQSFHGSKPSDLPKEVQEYAKDPRSAGLSFGSAGGWANPGNQCVHFSSSYFFKIWQGAKNMPKNVVMVDLGKNSASRWASAMGGSTSNKPKAGAIASVPQGQDGALSFAGHTFLVQHVFADGGILITEQNYAGLSGEANGTTDTWNYRYIPKHVWSDSHFSFFAPEGKPNWNAK